MLSVFERYAAMFRRTLARCFPRTRAFLDENGLRHDRPSGPSAADKASTSASRKKGSSAKGTARSRAPRKNAGQDVASAEPSKPKGESAPKTGIYPAKRMAIQPAQADAMRERVHAAVAAGVISAPSDEQWAMILSRHHATRVFAGAGSGKSATLILRVVFMLCHLNVPVDQVTVISFTNASCAELRARLSRVLSFWGLTLEDKQARQMVQTFHAAMAAMARDILPRSAWFEQLDEPATDEPENPLAGGRLKPAQQKLLKQAYQQAYAADEDFRQQIHALLGLSAPEPVAGRAKPKAPEEPFKLAGEFQAAPLYEVFFQQAGFIESIGLRIEELDARAMKCSPKEQRFLEALKRYWQEFQSLAQSKGLRTFNSAFQALTDQIRAGDAIPDEALTPLTHLLIDEFQDISPLIVQWLQAVHRAIGKRGGSMSLMAIGDDWQSIYGWRGSSPELFIDFDRHFPSRGKGGKSAVLLMETNYRSIEPVIHDAEKLLEDVVFKKQKTCRAHRSMQPGDHGVRVTTGFDAATGLPELASLIRKQCQQLSQRPGSERTAVLVLARRNEPLARIRALLDSALPVKAMTIHRAKGLQAEVAIILDDCMPIERHPLRNALYAHSGFFQNSYDQAMADEALRLGYVAVTRGVSRVFWFTRKRQGAAQRLC
jgi:superfamily I DNA/RNA helicase